MANFAALMRPNLILLMLCLAFGSQALSAQDPNPFELLWRKSGGTDSTSITPAQAPQPPAVSMITPEPRPDEEPAPKIIEVPPVTPSPVTATDTAQAVSGELSSTGSKAEQEPGDSASVVSALPAEHTSADSERKDTPLAFVILFGLIFSILAWVLSLNRELLKKIYRAALNENLSSLLFREQRFATTQYLYYTVYIIFFLSAGMFLFFLSRQFGWNAWALRTVWSCIAIILLVYLLRHISLAILGSTYPITKELTHFSFSILLHNILLGITLIPVNLFLAFGPDGMYKFVVIVGIILCILVYLLRQFRGMLISGLAINAHPFHFFIYLCAVEILPLFTLVKFFHN